MSSTKQCSVYEVPYIDVPYIDVGVFSYEERLYTCKFKINDKDNLITSGTSILSIHKNNITGLSHLVKMGLLTFYPLHAWFQERLKTHLSTPCIYYIIVTIGHDGELYDFVPKVYQPGKIFCHGCNSDIYVLRHG